MDLNASEKKPEDEVITEYLDEFKQFLESKKSAPKTKKDDGFISAKINAIQMPQDNNQSKYGFHFDDGETDNSTNSYHNSPQSPSLNSSRQTQRRLSPPASTYQDGNTQQFFQMPPPVQQQVMKSGQQQLLFPEQLQQKFHGQQNPTQNQRQFRSGGQQSGPEEAHFQMYQQNQMSSASQYNQGSQFPHHPNGLHAQQFYQQQQLRTGPLGAMQVGKVKATPIKKDTILYQIQFKMEFRYYVPSPFMTDVVGLNDFVVVETEKGEDLGIIVEFITFADFTVKKNREKQNSDSEDGRIIRRMKRLATEFDLALLPEKFHDESVVVSHSNEVVQHVLCMPLQVLGAEYSFDRKKLYVYYQTDSRRVDFKELIAKLFSIFKTCIWLRKHDQNVLNFQSACMPYAVLALRTGSLLLPQGNQQPQQQQQQQMQKKVFPSSVAHNPYANNDRQLQEQYFQQGDQYIQHEQKYQQQVSQFGKPPQPIQQQKMSARQQQQQGSLYLQEEEPIQQYEQDYFPKSSSSSSSFLSSGASVFEPMMRASDVPFGASLGVVHTAAGGIETYRARADSEEDIRY
eukprot:gene37087-45753_t